jgi:hypothetical protein
VYSAPIIGGYAQAACFWPFMPRAMNYSIGLVAKHVENLPAAAFAAVSLSDRSAPNSPLSNCQTMLNIIGATPRRSRRGAGRLGQTVNRATHQQYDLCQHGG